MPLITALGRQRQAALSGIEASLVYRARAKTRFKATPRKPCLENPTNMAHEAGWECQAQAP